MLIEEALIAKLLSVSGITNLIGSAVSMNIEQCVSTYPRVLITKISTTRDRHLKGVYGTTQARFQLDCEATSTTSAKAIGEAIRVALDQSATVTYPATWGGGSGLYIRAARIDDQRDDFQAPAAGETVIQREQLDLIVHWTES